MFCAVCCPALQLVVSRMPLQSITHDSDFFTSSTMLNIFTPHAAVITTQHCAVCVLRHLLRCCAQLVELQIPLQGITHDSAFYTNATILNLYNNPPAPCCLCFVLLCWQLVESRMPLQGITLPNKVGKPVGVPKLPLM
jgi:hypothetical protein